MNLGLFFRDNGPVRQPSGMMKIGTKELFVGDVDTGEKVENVTAMVWGQVGDNLCGLIIPPQPLFTPQHFEEGKDYVVVVFECDAAQNLDPRTAPKVIS